MPIFISFVEATYFVTLYIMPNNATNVNPITNIGLTGVRPAKTGKDVVE